MGPAASGRVLAALLAWMPMAAWAVEAPERVVGEFYDRFIHPRPAQYGWDDYRRVEELLGSELREAMRTQREYEKACARVGPPDIKPYMLDQNPFFLAPDGAKSLLSTRVRIAGKYAKVVARLAYDGMSWEDTVVLRRDEGHWGIVQVLWGEGGTLTNRLVEFARYRCAPVERDPPAS